MDENVFFKIDNQELFLEAELVSYNEIPVFFVCRSGERRFLVLCIDIKKEIYLVTSINTTQVLSLINGRESMRNIFLSGKKYWKIETGLNVDDDIVSIIDKNSINLEDLPVEGAKYKIVSGEIDKYRNELVSTIFDAESWNQIINAVSISMEDIQKIDVGAICNAIEMASNRIDYFGEYTRCFSTVLEFALKKDGKCVDESKEIDDLNVVKETYIVKEVKKLIAA